MHDHEYDYGPDHEPVEHDIPFASRVRILAEAWEARDSLADRSEGFKEFFSWSDYALPLCVELEDGGSRELDEDDYDMILEAWVEFTHLLDIDHHYPFASLDECLSAARADSSQ